MFPIPFASASFYRLARQIGHRSRGAYALKRRAFSRGFAQSNYSGCTHGRGHFVPEVVPVRGTRHLEWCRVWLVEEVATTIGTKVNFETDSFVHSVFGPTGQKQSLKALPGLPEPNLCAA